MQEFASVFEGLEDPRTGNRKTHELLEMLFIALCTVLCGGQSCADMELFGKTKFDFLKTILTLKGGIPSHDTFSRVFKLLDPKGFHDCFVVFMQRFATSCQGVVAIDGKCLRGSFDKAKSKSALHMVQAFGVETGLMFGQIAVDEKSNEITAVPKLLELLALDGCLVTIDAMGCQREIAEKICDQGGDYILALKGNQGQLFDDVKLFLDDEETELESAEQTDKGHGRIEVRKAFVSHDIAWLQESHDWPHLKAIAKIVAYREDSGVAYREEGGKVSSQTRYYLISRKLDTERLNGAVRSHWGIENTLHWSLDVTFGEDQARNREGNGPENLGLLRRLALNMAKQETSRGSMRGKLKRAGWDNSFLLRLLGQSQNL